MEVNGVPIRIVAGAGKSQLDVNRDHRASTREADPDIGACEAEGRMQPEREGDLT